MAAADVFAALSAHWSETVPYLTAEDVQMVRETARLTAAAAAGSGDAREARAAVLRLTMLLADRLPAAHPVSAAISGGTRLAGTTSGMGEIAAALGVIVGLTAVAQGGPDGDPAHFADDPDDPLGHLLTARALTGQQVRDGGADPGLPGLIRLAPPDGTPRIPAFQLSQAGQPIPVVLTINHLLGADDDPFGVADWWLGRNAWLDAVPADLLGQVDDALLVRAARAELPGE